MRTMTAYQLTGWGRPPEFVEVPVPRPGPGEVLVEVGGVGLCHSDFLFLDAPEGALPYPLPFTLGHEIAGRVAERGDGVDDLADSDAVIVAGISSCGRCRFCLRGADNYCVQGWRGRGYGADGGLAGYVAVARRHLVPLGGLDPRAVPQLADAGATSYHAVRRVLPRLTPGESAVVIGVGGLGQYAVQWLRLLSPARVVAVDVAPARLEVARGLGAHAAVPAGPDAARELAGLLGERRAAGVFDFVGTDETAALALGAAAPLGAVALVGAGGGTARVRWGGVPFECDVFIPQAATLADLHQVVALAAAGVVRSDAEHFPFAQTPLAYRRFRAGELRGRAVVLPNG